MKVCCHDEASALFMSSPVSAGPTVKSLHSPFRCLRSKKPRTRSDMPQLVTLTQIAEKAVRKSAEILQIKTK